MKRVAGAMVVASCVAGPLRADTLEVLSHSAVFDQATRLVHFELEFNREPDFYLLDPEGRQADSFQFHLDTRLGNFGWGGASPFPWESIVRGDEIHVDGDVRIRDHILGPSGKPGSGGWGPIAGAVPYTLTGTTQTFSAPYSMLNTTTGKFYYELELYEYGEWTRVTYRGFSAQVPAPAGVLCLGSAVVLVGARRRRS